MSETTFNKNAVVGFVTAVRKEQDTRNNAKFVAQETGAQVNIIEGISILEGSAAVEIDSSTKIASINLGNKKSGNIKLIPTIRF